MVELNTYDTNYNHINIIYTHLIVAAGPEESRVHECPHNATSSRRETPLRGWDCATSLWPAKTMTSLGWGTPEGSRNRMMMN